MFQWPVCDCTLPHGLSRRDPACCKLDLTHLQKDENISKSQNHTFGQLLNCAIGPRMVFTNIFTWLVCLFLTSCACLIPTFLCDICSGGSEMSNWWFTTYYFLIRWGRRRHRGRHWGTWRRPHSSPSFGNLCPARDKMSFKSSELALSQPPRQLFTFFEHWREIEPLASLAQPSGVLRKEHLIF